MLGWKISLVSVGIEPATFGLLLQHIIAGQVYIENCTYLVLGVEYSILLALLW